MLYFNYFLLTWNEMITLTLRFKEQLPFCHCSFALQHHIEKFIKAKHRKSVTQWQFAN